MKQTPIDLMPDSIRARSQAGAVVRRYVVVLLVGVAVTTAPATHARLLLRTATMELDSAKKMARDANESDKKYSEIQVRLDESRDFIGRYEQVAMPFEVGRLMATIVNDLPPSATLDSINLQVVTPPRRGVPRGAIGENPGRFLHGELRGFAETDGEAHDLAVRINRLGLCDDAKVESTSQRIVRDKKAREFRITFRIDLSRPIEVVDRDDSARQWIGHVK